MGLESLIQLVYLFADMQLDDQMGGRHYPASFLICQSKYIKEKSIIQGLKEKKLKYIGVRIMVKRLN